MSDKKYPFLDFRGFSYNNALNNYAEMQRFLTKFITDAYDKAYGAKNYNEHKDLLDRTLRAINVFEFAEGKTGKKSASFPEDADLKKVDAGVVKAVREAKQICDDFMGVIKDHYYVANRDEFVKTYGDVRLDRDAVNLAAEAWKWVCVDRKRESERTQFRHAKIKMPDSLVFNPKDKGIDL